MVYLNYSVKNISSIRAVQNAYLYAINGVHEAVFKDARSCSSHHVCSNRAWCWQAFIVTTIHLPVVMYKCRSVNETSQLSTHLQQSAMQ